MAEYKMKEVQRRKVTHIEVGSSGSYNSNSSDTSVVAPCCLFDSLR
jgi:hypothetical protein